MAIDMMEIDVAKIDSAVVRRLIEEVRDEQGMGIENQPQMYDRVHNRHNRGNGAGHRRPQPLPEPTPTPEPEEEPADVKDK